MERALRDLLMAVHDVALAAADASGNITVFSPAFRDMVGDVHPRTTSELAEFVPLHDDKGRRFTFGERPFARAMRGEVVRDLVARVRHTDDTWRYIRFNAAPIGPPTQVRGAIVLAQDVSEAHERTRLASEFHAELVTTINHHFRTPLSLVLGHAEILEDYEDALPAEVRTSVKALVRGAQQLHEMTRAVSELVESRSAHLVNVRRGDLWPYLRRQVQLHERSATARGIQFDLIPEQPFVVAADLELLARGFGALLNNTLRFAPPDSTVSVQAGFEGDDARLTVSDEGPGIRTADMARLVQPFETSATEQLGERHRGLGLALAQNVAAAHGGRLILRNLDPRGLEAAIEWPREHNGLTTPA